MNDHANSETQNTLLVAGGLALMVFGAGLLMGHPAVRRAVVASVTPLLPDLQEPLKAGAVRVLPDIERYLKIKAM
jgi:hypothetical protein